VAQKNLDQKTLEAAPIYLLQRGMTAPWRFSTLTALSCAGMAAVMVKTTRLIAWSIVMCRSSVSLKT